MNKWSIQINSLDVIQLHYIYLDYRSRKCVICWSPLRWIKTIHISCFVLFHLDPILTGNQCLHFLLLIPFCSHLLIIKNLHHFKLLNYLLAVPHEYLICNTQGPSSYTCWDSWGRLLYWLLKSQPESGLPRGPCMTNCWRFYVVTIICHFTWSQQMKDSWRGKLMAVVIIWPLSLPPQLTKVFIVEGLRICTQHTIDKWKALTCFSVHQLVSSKNQLHCQLFLHQVVLTSE